MNDRSCNVHSPLRVSSFSATNLATARFRFCSIKSIQNSMVLGSTTFRMLVAKKSVFCSIEIRKSRVWIAWNVSKQARFDKSMAPFVVVVVVVVVVIVRFDDNNSSSHWYNTNSSIHPFNNPFTDLESTTMAFFQDPEAFCIDRWDRMCSFPTSGANIPCETNVCRSQLYCCCWKQCRCLKSLPNKWRTFFPAEGVAPCKWCNGRRGCCLQYCRLGVFSIASLRRF